MTRFGRTGATVAALLLMAALLAGCWNQRELNSLGIALGFGIDKFGDRYRISAQVVDPGEVASSRPTTPGRSPVVLYKAEAPTVFEALRRLTEICPRKLYAAHIRVLIIGEALAREGVGKVLDLLLRDPGVRSDFYMLVAKDTTAEKVLQILTPLDKIPSYKMFDMLEASAKAWAPTTTFTLDEFVNQLVSEGLNPVLTGIQVAGAQEEGESMRNVSRIEARADLRTAGLAVFRKDKLIGWFDEKESIGYNLLKDKVKSTVSRISCPNGGYIVLETIRSKTDVKGRVSNGRPAIDVKLKTEVNIGEVECDLSITVPKNIRWIENKLKQRRIETMQAAVEQAKANKTDSFGFGQAINRSHPKYWKSISESWAEEFGRLPVNYKIEVIVRRVGTTLNTFLKEIKE